MFGMACARFVFCFPLFFCICLSFQNFPAQAPSRIVGSIRWDIPSKVMWIKRDVFLGDLITYCTCYMYIILLVTYLYISVLGSVLTE